jgi:hypothetical protein
VSEEGAGAGGVWGSVSNERADLSAAHDGGDAAAAVLARPDVALELAHAVDLLDGAADVILHFAQHLLHLLPHLNVRCSGREEGVRRFRLTREHGRWSSPAFY